MEQIGSNLRPVLEPLRSLPPTLLHGDMSPYNVSIPATPLLDSEPRAWLLDWQDVCQGPAIIDLISLYHAQIFRRSSGRESGRSVPLIDWEDFANYYFDALEGQLRFSVDRAAHLAAVPAATINLALRRFLVCAGLTLSGGQLDFLFRAKQVVMKPLAAWADLPGFLEYFVNFPIELVTEHARATYGPGLFGGFR